MAEALKAYVLSDRTGYVEQQRVTFAQNARDARRSGLDDVHYINTAAHRAPELDRFAPGPVPMRELMRAGWWRECGGCCRVVRYDDEGAIVTDDDAFCGAACRARVEALCGEGEGG